MPVFAYVAKSREGKQERGNITADNRQAALRALQMRGLVPDRVTEQGKERKARRDRRVKTTEVLIFTRQLSTIVSAGLPLLQGLDILAEQMEDPRFAAVIQDIGQDVEAGETFSESLRKHLGIFPDLYCSMVKAGEASGNLDGVLLQLADYLEATEELKRRIKSAMTYPVAAFSFILLIASGLIMFVVPKFQDIFSTMGAKLPTPTLLLISVSEIMTSWKMGIVVVAFIAAVVAVRLYGRTPIGRYNIDHVKLRLPIFGKLLRKVSVSRVTRTLSTLTRSGVAILAALEIVERTAGNEVFARAVRNAGDSVRKGETLADPLARSGEFPAMVTRMIGVGEKTGALEQMLSKIADFYDSEVKSAVDSLTSLIEPILILFMGIVVGGMVIALFMPIMNLSQLIKPGE